MTSEREDRRSYAKAVKAASRRDRGARREEQQKRGVNPEFRFSLRPLRSLASTASGREDRRFYAKAVKAVSRRDRGVRRER